MVTDKPPYVPPTLRSFLTPNPPQTVQQSAFLPTSLVHTSTLNSVTFYTAALLGLELWLINPFSLIQNLEETLVSFAPMTGHSA